MADNYGRCKRFGMQIYRALRLKLQYHDKVIAKDEAGNAVIRDFILSGKPGMVGRIGAVESRFISASLHHREPTPVNLHHLRVCAGVFPTTEQARNAFYDAYTKALSETDIFVAWSVQGGRQLYDAFCPDAALVGFYALEPFFFAAPWTSALKGKRVLVVHPFAETIRRQYQQRQTLFEDPAMLPEFGSLCFVKAVQSNAENDRKLPFSSWSDALEHMKQEIASQDFEVAIIGAGSYGLPLAAYVKSLGKQAIHVAGVTQMLFGIRGKRWDADPLYQRFFNENWVYPSPEETPDGIRAVEGGSYWK